MSATLELPRRPAEPEGPSAGRPWVPPFAAGARDDWPRTNRWIPWLLAAFLVMLWLVPFDSTSARFDAPFDPKLDRLLISVMALAWLASVFAGGRVSPRWHRTALDWAVLAFVGVAVASVLLNIGTLVNLQEHELATKKLSLLFSYATFFFIVATTIRPREIARFVKLFCVLAFVAALGTLYHKHIGGNLFFAWWQQLVPDAALQVDGAPAGHRFSGPVISGPAKHPLALALMMATAIPFMAVGLLNGRTQRSRILYAIGFAVLLAAVFATSRKTGSYASIAAMMTLVALRPRQMARLLPHGLVIFVVLLVAFPNAVTKQLQEVNPNRIAEGASGENRKTDYEAVVPDVRENLLAGRGYGTYDPQKYRILDNNYLGMLLETGILGVAAFLFMVVALIAAAWRPMRSADPARAGPALAAAGGAVAFAVGMALFDALAYPQGPYMFFFLGAIAVVAGAPAMRDLALRPAVERPAEERPTEVLPPLRAPLAPEPLPALERDTADEAERVREGGRGRDEAEHAGGRTRRREGLPSRRRAQPVREHVSGPLPGAPAPDADDEAPAPRRRRAPGAALGARARRAGTASLAAARRRTGSLLVGLAALAVAALAFGGGAEREADVPQLGAGGSSGDDPLGLDQFAPPGKRGEGSRERDGRGGRDGRAPERGPGQGQTVPVSGGDGGAGGGETPVERGGDGGERGAGGGERGDRGERGEGRDERRKRRRKRRRRGDDGAPGTTPPPDDRQPPQDDPPQQEDCLPGDVEPILTDIDVDPCQPAQVLGVEVQEALLAGRLTREQADAIVASLREAQAARG